MESYYIGGGRALRIAVGITMLVFFLLAGIASSMDTTIYSTDIALTDYQTPTLLPTSPEMARPDGSQDITHKNGLLDRFHISGMLEANGTHFELKNSSYLNITLDSSESINLTLESAPEMVTMHIESASGAASAQISIVGFAPLTTYHRYEDDYHNHTSFTTYANGSYTYTQDLSNNHLIFIQPRPSTKFINDNATGGDCTLIGTWNSATKTCTLTTDLTETVQIDSNGVTLDGNGHNLTGNNTGYGVYLSGRTGVTIRNLNVKRFYGGIYLYYSSSNTLSRNNVSNNGIGIYMSSSNHNTLSGNDVSATYGGISLDQSSSNTLNGNNISNNYDIGIYLSSYSDNNTLIGNNVSSTIPIYWSSGHGIILWGSNNTLIGNNVSKNIYGIFLPTSGKNILKKNNIKENRYNFGLMASSDSVFDNQIDATNLVDGKPVYYLKGAKDKVYDSYTKAGTFYCINCVNVTVKNLDLKNNGFGILFWNTTKSKIQNINASNNWHGISLYFSGNNTLSGSYVGSNCEGHAYGQDYGIFLYSSGNNTLSSNNVLNNCYGIHLDSSSNNTLINNNATSNNAMLIAAGISVEYSNSNKLSGNYVSDNDKGIIIYSNKNTIKDNNILNSHVEGIILGGNNNTLTGNNISNSGVYWGSSGIFISTLNNTLIYNNIFNNTNNIQFYDSNTNKWNTTKTSGINIVGGPYIGGNFWAYPNNTGFSQTCSDVNKDGICDSPYTLDGNNIDYLPLARYTAIRVTSPNGGETWARGSTQTIRWTYSGTPGFRVKIELLKNGAFNRMINSSVLTGSGSYRWQINASQTPGTNYKVRVKSTTNASYTDNINNNFTISGGITVTSPNGGETWARGSTQTIRWNYSGTPGSNVRIELLKGGALNRTINSSVPIGGSGSGSYSWLINLTQAPGNNYKVRIKSTSNPAYTDTSNNNFNISAS